MADGFPITITSRMKHGDLFAAAKKLGSQSALARHLSESIGNVGAWCNLNACPPTSVEDLETRGHNCAWTAERIASLENKLFALTGKLLSELFPAELREAREFLKADKTNVKTREVALAQLASNATDRLLLPHPDEAAMRNETKVAVGKVLKTLSFREREIIKLRYGIGGDGHTYTWEEIGHIFKVTRERIRQIELKAIRHLQNPNRAKHLVDLLDWTEEPDANGRPPNPP